MASYTLGLTFPAETVLFPGPSACRTIQLGTKNDWRLTYRYSIRGVGWNKKWRNSTQQFDYVYYEGSNTPTRWHPLANFGSLVP
jgi:hypothetical protein